MTRQECEMKLLELAAQMRAVYDEYNPAGDHLSVSMTRDGFIRVDDSFFTKDGEVIMTANDRVYRTVDVTRYSDGDIRYGCPAKDGAA